MSVLRVVDLETCGLDPKLHGVVEIGSIDLINGATDRAMQVITNPGVKIPVEAMAVHHITDEMVKDGPWFPETARRLLAPQEGPVAAFVAHNARFEQGWITSEFTEKTPWICTYKCALSAWPDAPGHSVQVLRYWLNLPVDPEVANQAHRALPDAYVTAYIVMELLKRFTIEEMVEITRRPALLPKIRFGKHAGQKWSDVPMDYLSWLLKQNLDDDTRYTAQYWFDNKRGR